MFLLFLLFFDVFWQFGHLEVAIAIVVALVVCAVGGVILMVRAARFLQRLQFPNVWRYSFGRWSNLCCDCRRSGVVFIRIYTLWILMDLMDLIMVVAVVCCVSIFETYLCHSLSQVLST